MTGGRRGLGRWGALLLGLSVGCASGDKAGDSADSHAVPETGCNGHDELCARPVTEVTFPGTHNSMSNADAEWTPPNQQHGITQQLEDGIRGLMLDTHEWEGGLWLCHSYCSLGAQPLDEGLAEIETFMAAHPREVIQIIFQDAISSADSRASLDESGLGARLYAWQAGADPTLEQLIDNGTTLIVGMESGNGDEQGIHGAWDLWVDTPYSFETVDDFSCAQNRGDPSNTLFLVNHWLSNPFSSPENGDQANTAEQLQARAEQCVAEWGRPINFFGVDFYDRGALFVVVDRLNGVASDDGTR